MNKNRNEGTSKKKNVKETKRNRYMKREKRKMERRRL
jgi:hypothetical protein